MKAKPRVSFGATLPSQLLGQLDTLRNRNSRDKQFARRNRSEVIEILLLEALHARKQHDQSQVPGISKV